MNIINLITVVALLQLFLFSAFVGYARRKYQVKAPAVTGHEIFERAYRIQVNTIELLVLLIPSLYIASRYWPVKFVALMGAIYLIGRVIYRWGYMKNPEARATGFLLSIVPVAILLLASLVGVVRALLEQQS